MLIYLIRNKPRGKAIFGQMEAFDTPEAFRPMDTLENLDYAIPAGFYRLRVTYSPKFQELLPILDGVYGFAKNPKNGTRRTGIRIHAGNTIEDTTGCILVGEADLGDEAIGLSGDKPKSRLLSSRRRLNELREFLLNYQKTNPNEEVYIEIMELDDHPEYDLPYVDPSSEWA